MWLMTRMSVEEEMAIQIGQKMVDSYYIHRTKDNKASAHDDRFTNSTDVYKFYVLYPLPPPMMIGSEALIN